MKTKADKTVRGKKLTLRQLKPGDLVESGGSAYAMLIVTTSALSPRKSKFYGSGPWVKYFSLRDAYYGPESCAVAPDESFCVVAERGTEKYVREVRRLVRERVDRWSDAERDVELLHSFLRAGKKKRSGHAGR